MHMKTQLILYVTFTIMIFPNFSVYGEQNYQLVIDEHSFEIIYNFNGEVIAMMIDPELSSLLIGTENVEADSIFQIELEHQLINAENNQFAVLVNGFEEDYEIAIKDTSSVLRFYIPAYTEEIEIIGTHVIPEFPLGALFSLTALTLISLIAAKYKMRFR